MLTEPNKSNIENLHARAGSRIRVTEPCLKSPAQLDMSSMTRAPFEAKRSTGLYFFKNVDRQSEILVHVMEIETFEVSAGEFAV